MEQFIVNINNINCVMTIEGNEVLILPFDRTDSFNLYQHFNKLKTNFKIHYEHPVFKKSFVNVKRIISWDIPLIKLLIEYKIFCLEDDIINSFEISGDQLDWFFNPLEYYFRIKTNNGKMPEDLLYNSEIIKRYSFIFENQEITIEISYGEILKKGVFSDLQIHAKLKVNFKDSNDFDFIYRVYLIIVRFVNIVSYQINFNHKRVEFLGKSKSSDQSHKGYLNVKNYNLTTPDNHVSNLLRTWDPYIEPLLNLLVKDNNISIQHLPHDRNSLYKTRITRFSSIFAAFEVEFKKLYKDVTFSDSIEISKIKNTFVKKLKDNLSKTQNANEKWFLNEVKNRVDQIGTSFGQRAKIKYAYEQNIEIFKDSFSFSEQKGFKFDQTMDKVNKLRGLIFHENYVPNDIDDYEKPILFIEILTMILFLRRLNMNSYEIEKVIGNIFMDNEHFMD